MQQMYRATRRHQPSKSDTLVSSPEQARSIIANLDRKLAGKLPSQERATYLCARTVLYEALGDKKMLESAQEAYKFTKTAQSAALVAVALHHFGRIKEANEWYERSYRQPHEAGWEVDIGYSNSLLSQGRYLEAWPIVKQLKKRMVYSAYLPFWDGKPCEELQVISEGGNGDLIINSRYLPLLKERGVKKVTVFLPPFFFEQGFVKLAEQQGWWPEIKVLTEARAGVPSAGFFDLPAIFETTLENIPPPPVWKVDPEKQKSFDFLRRNSLEKPRVGFCWFARQMETPICPDGIYRSLTTQQAEKIISNKNVNWFSLQRGGSLSGLPQTELKDWSDTAAVIANLDFVVTVDTAIAHLAASMCKPTWVILSGAVDWKFRLEGDTCPWYPQWRLFRNDEFGFNKAVDKVIAALKEIPWPIAQSVCQTS